MWQGEKSNTKWFHLVNWNIAKDLKDCSSLGIEDPFLMNSVLGAKLVWRMALGKLDSWKKVIHKKYFNGDHIQCIINPLESKNGSSIWKLIKAISPIVKSKITWILLRRVTQKVFFHVWHPSMVEDNET
jgi:hypothetical protein